MRILVDLGEEQVRALDRRARAEGRSRAALIRDAVGQHLSAHDGDPLAAAFGIWRSRKIDGLAYQEKLRSEW